MKLAFIFNWHVVMQRPHHWVAQAIAYGNEADVYSPGKWPFFHGTPVPYDLATNMYFEPMNILYPIARRIPRIGMRLARPIRERMADRSASLWEKIWHGEFNKKYDAVVVCGPAPRNVYRKGRLTRVIYDCMDEWAALPSAPLKALEYEQSLISVADAIWAVTPNLANRISETSPKSRVHLIPNACDYEYFSRQRILRRPSKWKNGTPIIGYAGTISAWFDWAAVNAIAAAMPNAIVWLIGPHDHPIPSALPSNIILEGFVPYSQIAECIAAFDIAIIPFKGDLLMKGVSPIKLYEYLAAGKPVVASAMPDVLQLESSGIVEKANTPNAFAGKCAMLVTGDITALAAARQKLAIEHSWGARWQKCESIIRDLL